MLSILAWKRAWASPRRRRPMLCLLGSKARACCRANTPIWRNTGVSLFWRMAEILKTLLLAKLSKYLHLLLLVLQLPSRLDHHRLLISPIWPPGTTQKTCPRLPKLPRLSATPASCSTPRSYNNKSTNSSSTENKCSSKWTDNATEWSKKESTNRSVTPTRPRCPTKRSGVALTRFVKPISSRRTTSWNSSASTTWRKASTWPTATA